MIIECPVCNKKFDIDQSLIPSNGRLLQCGGCNHKWFFKFSSEEKTTNESINIDSQEIINDHIETENNDLEKEINIVNTEIQVSKKKDKKNTNYFNILLVIILSIIAFILVLDTFKNELTSVFPNIKFLLNNLYQSIEDMKLFALDLIR